MQAEAYLEALRACPVTTIRELTGGRPFVILSPHPDDETLGAGGLIAEACAGGYRLDIIIVTDGSGSHPRSRQYPRERLVDLRYAEVHKAGMALGLPPDRVHFLGLPDTMAPKSGPEFDAAADKIRDVILQSGAGALFVTAPTAAEALVLSTGCAGAALLVWARAIRTLDSPPSTR